RRAVEMLPQDRLGWQALGQSLMATGEREQAEIALARFTELEGQSAPGSVREQQAQARLDNPTGTQLDAAMGALAAGDGARALAIARTEAALAPDALAPRLTAVQILLATKQADEALREAEAAVQLAPEQAVAVHHRGLAHMERGDTSAAKRDMRRAIELDENFGGAYNDLAVLLMREGELLEARDLLTRALALNPENTLARQNLEWINDQLGG
ncbi:MAG: tetratricopeptide repeat protein, partial [Acidobacteriota bacterium]